MPVDLSMEPSTFLWIQAWGLQHACGFKHGAFNMPVGPSMGPSTCLWIQAWGLQHGRMNIGQMMNLTNIQPIFTIFGSN